MNGNDSFSKESRTLHLRQIREGMWSVIGDHYSIIFDGFLNTVYPSSDDPWLQFHDCRTVLRFMRGLPCVACSNGYRDGNRENKRKQEKGIGNLCVLVMVL